MSLRQKTGLVEVSTNAQNLSSIHLPSASGKTPSQSRNGSPVSSLARRAGRTRTRDVLFDIPHTAGKFELIKACTALHLETSGTVAHLRARLANYISTNFKLEHYFMKEMKGWWLTQSASDPKKIKREWIIPAALEKVIFQGVRGKEPQVIRSGSTSGTASLVIKKELELAPPLSGLSLKEDTFDRLVLLDDNDDEKSDATLTSNGARSSKSVSDVDHDRTITLEHQDETETFDFGSPTGTIQLSSDALRATDDIFSLSDVASTMHSSSNPAISNRNYGHDNNFTNATPSFPTNDASVSWKEFERHRQTHIAEMNELTMMLKVLADEMRDIDDVLLEQSAEILHNKAEISQLEKMASSACSQTADQRNILYTAAQQIEQFQRESLQHRNNKHHGWFAPHTMGEDKARMGGPPYETPASSRLHSENFIMLKTRFQGLQRTTADALETVKRNHKRLNVTIAGIQMTEGVSPTEDAEAILNRLNFRPGSQYAAWRRYGEREDGVPFDPSQPPFLIIRFNSEFTVMDLLKTFNAFRNRFPDRKAPFKIMKDLTKNQVLEAKKVNEIILKWRKADGKDYRNRDGVIYLFENGVRVRKIAPGEGPRESNTHPSIEEHYTNEPYHTLPNRSQTQLAATHPGSFARALPPPPSQINIQSTMKRYDTTKYDYSNTHPSPHRIINFNHASPVNRCMGYNQPSPQHPQPTAAGYQHHLRQPYGIWYPPAATMCHGGFR